jgi:hypothetical protein
MKQFIFFIAFVFINSIAFSQLPPKIENDKSFGKDCYYLKQLPKNDKVKGVLVLIPGYGEHPYAVSVQTSILKEAEQNGIAVMMVNLTPNNLGLPIDNVAISGLAKMINHFYEYEKLLTTTPLYLGGFSIGGTTALKFYTQKNSEFKISKLFAIDPPLDMVRLRKFLLKGREKIIVEKLDSLITNKQEQVKELQELSVYNPNFSTAQKLPTFKQTALRIYCEPDILWWIKNRNMDLSDMNVTDCAGYINLLVQKDNTQKVELILTKDKGIRNGNQVHPHSWSIAEPIELITWLLQK